MEVKGLFEALAGYLDFLIDLLQLHGMEKYNNLGSISPTLVSYFVVGVFVAYLISSATKIPNYEKFFKRGCSSDTSSQISSATPTKTNDKSKDPVNKLDMARFVLLSILGAFLLHGFLKIYSAVFGSPIIHSVKDTLNAVFAYNALYHPLNALAKQLQRGVKAMVGINRTTNVLAAVLSFVLCIFYFAFLIYLLYPLAAVHGASIMSMLWPSIVFVVFVVALFALFIRVLRVPLKSGVTEPEKEA